jgi:alcohol dehydrogenase
MRAVVLRQHGGLDALKLETDYPKPLAGPDEVVLAVRACSLNHHDLFTMRGMPGIKVPLPIVIGIDLAGEIDSVGVGVSGWAIGERVVVDPMVRETWRLIGEMSDGGLAEYVKVPAAQLIRIPAEVSFEQAAALPVAYATAYRMMMARGQVKAGERVLVLGASGGVGVACVQLAKLAGAEVIACAGSDQKLAALGVLGADHLIDYAATDWVAETHKLFGKPRAKGGGGVDVVVNFTGGDTWVPSLRCLTKGGRMLTCGATQGYDPKTDIRFIWTFELDIRGSNCWEPSDIEALLDLVQDGRLSPVIGDRFVLEDARDALGLLERRQVFGKVIVTP